MVPRLRRLKSQISRRGLSKANPSEAKSHVVPHALESRTIVSDIYTGETRVIRIYFVNKRGAVGAQKGEVGA